MQTFPAFLEKGLFFLENHSRRGFGAKKAWRNEMGSGRNKALPNTENTKEEH